MKRLYAVFLILLFATSCLQIDAGSGKYWGIGLGSAAAGYTAGRLHGRSKRRREYREQPRYQETCVVQVTPANNLALELEEERAKRRRLENDLEDVERKNKRLKRDIESLEKENEDLKDQFEDVESRLKKLEAEA